MENVKQLYDLIRETSFKIHTYLRNGHLEKIYVRALVHRLQKMGLHIKEQYAIKIYDEDGTLLGEFYADIFVNNQLIVEISIGSCGKACKTLANEHIAQLLGYLRASKIEHGLLINFGAPKLQIRKYILNEHV